MAEQNKDPDTCGHSLLSYHCDQCNLFLCTHCYLLDHRHHDEPSSLEEKEPPKPEPKYVPAPVLAPKRPEPERSPPVSQPSGTCDHPDASHRCEVCKTRACDKCYFAFHQYCSRAAAFIVEQSVHPSGRGSEPELALSHEPREEPIKANPPATKEGLKKLITNPADVYSLLALALRELKVRDVVSWTKLKIHAPPAPADKEHAQIPATAPKAMCDIEFVEYPVETLVSFFNCRHHLCEPCFTKYIQTKADQKCGIDKCTCPVCAKPIPYQTIASVCGAEVARQLDQYYIVNKFPIYECPSCHEKFDATSHYGDRDRFCNVCKKSYCRLCMKQSHAGPCESRKEALRLISAAFKGSKYPPMPCPYCLQLGIKQDSDCERVKCEFCGNRFCNLCSAKRGPIEAHGNHYHRRECPHYAKFEGEEKMVGKCEECRKTGALCPRPGPLEDGDIPAAEFPQELRKNK